MRGNGRRCHMWVLLEEVGNNVLHSHTAHRIGRSFNSTHRMHLQFAANIASNCYRSPSPLKIHLRADSELAHDFFELLFVPPPAAEKQQSRRSDKNTADLTRAVYECTNVQARLTHSFEPEQISGFLLKLFSKEFPFQWFFCFWFQMWFNLTVIHVFVILKLQLTVVLRVWQKFALRTVCQSCQTYLILCNENKNLQL